MKARALVATLSQAEPARDQALVNQCLDGDAQAWRSMCRRHYPGVAATLRKLGVRDFDIEDAAQEVFVEVFRYLPSFRGEAQLSTWLYRLCVNRAYHVRRRVRMREKLQRFLLLAPARVAPEPPGLGEAQARHKIEHALEALSEKQRAVFVLYELENVPGKKIAEILSCPEATVWTRLHEARRSFLAAMDDLSRRKQAR